MQVAEFARYTGRRRSRRLLPRPVQGRPRAESGRARRKLSGGAAPHEAVWLFALQPRRDGHRLPDPVDAAEALWTFETADGRGIRKALTFMLPFIEDKQRWPYQPDVMYYDEWPMRHPALLFGARAFQVAQVGIESGAACPPIRMSRKSSVIFSSGSRCSGARTREHAALRHALTLACRRAAFRLAGRPSPLRACLFFPVLSPDQDSTMVCGCGRFEGQLTR